MSSTTIRYCSLPGNGHGVDDLPRSGPGSPLVEVIGDGFYDWAGRRLFLADGRPDPDTPGAYRYQHSPVCCDLDAPDSDPASPWYEPPYLRHQPGDTWQIGGKPYDPLDPGPFGSPGWYQDRRTGRHRRGELPDPLAPDDPSQACQVSPHVRIRGLTRRTESMDQRAFRPEQKSPRPSAEPPSPYRFSKAREEAWNRFLVESEPLSRAHLSDHKTAATVSPLARAARWIAALFRREETTRSSSLPHSRERRPTSPRWTPRHRRRSRPLRMKPYIAGWERAFDDRHAFERRVAME